MGSNLSAADFLEKLHKFWRQRFSQALSGLYILPGFAVFLLIIIGLGPPGVGQGIRSVSFRAWVKSAMAQAHRPWARHASPRNLGVAYAIKGRFEEAIARYQKAIDKTIIIFQNALKINPNNAIAQKMLSILKAPRPHN